MLPPIIAVFPVISQALDVGTSGKEWKSASTTYRVLSSTATLMML